MSQLPMAFDISVETYALVNISWPALAQSTGAAQPKRIRLAEVLSPNGAYAPAFAAWYRLLSGVPCAKNSFLHKYDYRT
jgi:hypothetical protein